MDVGIVSVPVIDCDPLKLGLEIAFHLGDEIAGEGFEIGLISAASSGAMMKRK
jgi:hypothetical protein